MRFAAAASLFVAEVTSYAFVKEVRGVDSSLFDSGIKRREAIPGSAAACPFNPNHVPAVPISAKYPYCGAVGGLPGRQSCTNNLVPASGDTAHYYQAPGANDIRGPCPGLNTAANHGFLARDGITTFAELVDMQQNVYGVGYDLAVLLAALGVGLDGDPVTTKLSIGCDATTRTAAAPGLGPELGLDGHNKFEGDTSLTRDDYFLGDGDNFSFNETKYERMSEVAQGNFGRTELALYRYQRYQESRATNPNFYFGPKSLLLFGAASFLYELFPSLGNAGTPDQTTMDYFFKKEQIPPNWYSRATPYTILDVAGEIGAQYQLHPVEFGGNAGIGNFFGIGENGYDFFNNGRFNGTTADLVCLIYQFATDNQPSSLTGNTALPTSTLKFMAGLLNPIYKAQNFGCPLAYNYS